LLPSKKGGRDLLSLREKILKQQHGKERREEKKIPMTPGNKETGTQEK